MPPFSENSKIANDPRVVVVVVEVRGGVGVNFGKSGWRAGDLTLSPAPPLTRTLPLNSLVPQRPRSAPDLLMSASRHGAR
jgi:hypothetical protein